MKSSATLFIRTIGAVVRSILICPSLFDTRGISLIEVMIAATITSIIALTMAQVVTNTSGQQRLLQARMERLDLETGLREQMDIPGLCTCNLRSQSFLDTAAGLSVGWKINDMSAFSQDCANSRPLAASNSRLAATQVGLRIGQMSIDEGFKVADDLYTFQLRVPYLLEGFALRDSVIKNINFKVKTVGGRKEVVGCGATTLPDVIPNARYVVTCTAMSGLTQSFTSVGTTNSNVLTRIAPSGMGYWVVAVSGNAIVDSHNCFADQVWPANNTENAVALCRNNASFGTPCPAYGNCTYAAGRANPFNKCTYGPQ